MSLRNIRKFLNNKFVYQTCSPVFDPAITEYNHQRDFDWRLDFGCLSKYIFIVSPVVVTTLNQCFLRYISFDPWLHCAVPFHFSSISSTKYSVSCHLNLWGNPGSHLDILSVSIEPDTGIICSLMNFSVIANPDYINHRINILIITDRSNWCHAHIYSPFERGLRGL